MLKSFSQQKTALGSEITLSLVGKNLDVLKSQMYSLWLEIDEFELKYSRFRENSELNSVNNSAGEKTEVSEEFVDIIQKTLKIASGCNDLFNPLILPALQNAGYKNSFVTNNTEKIPDFSNRNVESSKNIKIDSNFVTIPKNTALDFGGCGKGYLADKIANITDKNRDITGYYFSLGGDLVLKGHDENGKNWNVAIQDSLRPDEDIGNIKLGSNRLAIATSGTIRRFGTKNGKKWHHLIDPITLKPAKTNILLTTICDQSALKADILATCTVISSTKSCQKLLSRNNITDYLIQPKDSVHILLSGNIIKLYT